MTRGRGQNIRIIQVVLQGERQPGMIAPDGFRCTQEGLFLRAFNMHLNKINLREIQISDYAVNSRDRDLY
jgi:hypothetical protein